MTRFTSVLFAIVVALGMGFAIPTDAQSTQDMSVLTAEERADFSTRLQQAKTSAERARVTAEMNVLIQQRKLERRRESRDHGGDGPGGGGGKGNNAR